MTLKLKISILTLICGLFLLSSTAYSQNGKGTGTTSVTPSTATNVKKELPEIKGWEKADAANSENPDDYIVNYQSDKAGKVTVYIYTGGVKNIPNGVMDKVIADEMEGAKGAIAQLEEVGIYTDVKSEETKTINLSGKNGKLKTLYTHYNLKAKGTPLVSDIYLFGHQSKFIKIRSTRLQDQETSGQAAVTELLTELEKYFSN